VTNRPQSTDREKALEVYRLATDLHQDLIVAARAHKLFYPLVSKFVGENPAAVALEVGFRRLYLFHIIMLLAKVSELYKRNRAILPLGCREEFKALVKRIEERGILRFRNAVAGHLYDKETQKSLTATEVNARANKITEDNLEGFFLWVNNKADNSYPTTVVSIVERARDLLRNEHNFRKNDL
jgi:hypothetical protein